MKEIIDYLRKEYAPKGILVYGSFANGTNGAGSDFDALIISDNAKVHHDNTVVAGTELDVFIYSPERFDDGCDPVEFIQVLDGKIIEDETGALSKLKQEVSAYAANRVKKSEEELRTSVEWCRKMLLRTQREDAEGYYRWHWLLTDSLEIYSDIYRAFYQGPKKTLRWMEEIDPEAFVIYHNALRSMDRAVLELWVRLLEHRIK